MNKSLGGLLAIAAHGVIMVAAAGCGFARASLGAFGEPLGGGLIGGSSDETEQQLRRSKLLFIRFVNMSPLMGM